MKAFNKQAETKTLEAVGVTPDKYCIQFNKAAPHIRLYEKQTQKSGRVINKKVGEFYKVRKAIQRAWSMSQGTADE
jgi:hypothetical protein